jgi:hypothetical protein
MMGGGKYGPTCERVREELEASAVALIVFQGKHGHGFSVVGFPGFDETLPEILEDIANQIRADRERNKKN